MSTPRIEVFIVYLGGSETIIAVFPLVTKSHFFRPFGFISGFYRVFSYFSLFIALWKL